MKQFNLVAILAIVAFLFGIQACTENTAPAGDDNVLEEFYLLTPDNSASEIAECDQNNDMELLPQDNTEMMKQPPRRRNHLGRVLWALELTDEQKAQVREFSLSYRDCMIEARTGVRESEREIIMAANEQRKLYIEQFRNGELERAELFRLLQELNKETREALYNNEDRIESCLMMKACRESYFEDIASILTEEQLELWNEWVESLPEIECE